MTVLLRAGPAVVTLGEAGHSANRVLRAALRCPHVSERRLYLAVTTDRAGAVRRLLGRYANVLTCDCWPLAWARFGPRHDPHGHGPGGSGVSEN